MKKIFSLLGTIPLIGTSTTSLVACDNKVNKYSLEELANLKEKNSKTINGNKLEWISQQEKSFNQVDNKWYFIVWRDSKNGNWNINKFNNNKETILITADTRLQKSIFGSEYDLTIRVPEIHNMIVWKEDDGTYFKAVYLWNSDKPKLPDLVIDENGNIKVNK